VKLTARQKQAARLLKGVKNALLYGGSRSGKTFVTIDGCCLWAYSFEGLRILICRRYAVDIRASIWAITIPEILRQHGFVAGQDYTINQQDMTIRFNGGGMIICAGLDDKERVDKVLGQEYAVIYINESQDIPWSTVNTLKTRLSQNIPGFQNRFVCDLNPTTDAHWTYKLFFQNVHPETKDPLNAALYGRLQMNAVDNVENLPEGYIDEQLGSLVGNARQRFLLGEYQSSDGLRVFSPKSIYEWPEFEQWLSTRQNIVKFTAGLDLGYNDADAFVILAHVPDEPEVWLIFEHKARRQSLQELANAMRGGLAWLRANVPARDHSCPIYAETATIRYGHEGDNKKTSQQLAEMFGFDIHPAYKRDKKLGIEQLQDTVNSGRFHIPRLGPFMEETENTIWTRNTSGTIERIIDDEAYHPDLMDAILYPMREIWTYAGDEHKRLPDPPPPPPAPSETEQVLNERFAEAFGSDNWRDW